MKYLNRLGTVSVLLGLLPLAFCGCEQKTRLKNEISSLRLQIEQRHQESALALDDFHKLQKQVSVVGGKTNNVQQLLKQVESTQADIELLKAELAREQANLKSKTAILDSYRARFYGKN